MTRLHYLGPAGTFTELAAQRLARRAGLTGELVAASSTQAAFNALRADASAGAVVPYYNYLEGLVQETIDGVFDTGVRIVAAERLPVVFAIGTHPANPRVEVVFSHPKGLAQCSDYLREKHPEARLQSVTSTAEAARLAAETPASAAIARREALVAAGLTIERDDIGNVAHGRRNYTEFLLLGTFDLPAPADAPYRTMLAVMPYEERVGLLADILNQFAFYRINLAKIHSRPGVARVRTALDPQMFYFEVEGRDDSADFVACRAALNHRFGTPGGEPPMTSLGCYPLFDDDHVGSAR